MYVPAFIYFFFLASAFAYFPSHWGVIIVCPSLVAKRESLCSVSGCSGVYRWAEVPLHASIARLGSTAVAPVRDCWQAWANAVYCGSNFPTLSRRLRLQFPKLSSRNMWSAYDHPEVVSAYLGHMGESKALSHPCRFQTTQAVLGLFPARQVAAHLGLVQTSRQKRE